MKKFRQHILLLLIIVTSSHYSFGQTDTVSKVLSETQNKMQEAKIISCNLEYSLYPNYATTKFSEQFQGAMVKYNETLYTKIHHTTFLNTPKVSLKLNFEERAMLLYEGDYKDVMSQSPIEALNTFVELFKTKTIKDLGNQWLCTLTTDVITQIPYGKVEIYINKKDYSISKQIIYFLTQLSYKNDKGEVLLGNPRMEIKLSDMDTKVSKEQIALTKLSNYIKYVGNTPVPVQEYIDFKLTKTN